MKMKYSIPTAVELGAGLNPLDSRDSLGDLDHDGLSNLFEYEHGLDMRSNDTDHDGIDDGAELRYWQNKLEEAYPEWSEVKINSMAINNTRNPDADNDSIPDGKEIKGYTVKIIVGWKEDGTPVSEMQNVSREEMDPLVPYGYEVGKKTMWTDTDGDGIPDVVEVYLSNRSRWGEFEANYSDLWSEYSWIADYYATIEKRENESAAEQWLRTQFNPLVVENTPPVVVKFTVKWRIVVSLNPPGTSVYANVTVLVRDVGGIAYLRVLDENNGDSVILRNAGTSVKVEHNFSASLWQAGFGAVTIRVEAEDNANNTLSVEKELKGAVGQMLDALAKIWDAIWNTLCKVANAVMSAMSALLQWIMSVVNTTLSRIFAPLINVVNSWISDINYTILGSWNYYRIHGSLGGWEDKLSYLFNVELLVPTMAISIGLISLIYLISGLTMGIGSMVLSMVSGLIAEYIMMSILQTVISSKKINIDIPSEPVPALIVSFVKMLYDHATQKPRVLSEKIKSDGYDMDLFWGYLSALLGVMSSVLTLWVICKADFTGTGATTGEMGFAIQALLVGFLALSLSFNKTAGMIVGGIAAALGGISLIFGVFAEKPTVTMLRILNYVAQIMGWVSILIYVVTVMGWV